MADIKITDLTAYTDPVSTDVLPIVDVGSDVTKKVSIADLLENAGTGTAAAPSFSFDGDNDTGLYQPGADQLAISTNGTGRLFVNSSGNVFISGSTAATADIALNADGSAQFTGPVVYQNTSAPGGTTAIQVKDGSSTVFRVYANGETVVTNTAYFGSAGNTKLYANGGVDVAGNLTIGQSSTLTSSGGAQFVDDVLIGGVLPASPNIELNADGSIVALADATINSLTVGLGGGSVAGNTAIGRSALNSNTTGVYNTSVGREALRDNTEGNNNTAIGYASLQNNTTGDNNIAVGRNALSGNTEGNNNTALGYLALYQNTEGNNNTAVGSLALYQNTEGTLNTAVGYSALRENSVGSFNTAVGRNAGYYIEGSNNTILGAYQGTSADATLSNTVIISAGSTERARCDSSGTWQFPGSVSIGGTAAANTIDEYEEGTSTVDLTVGGVAAGLTGNDALSTYTRIGNLCQVQINLTISSASVSGKTGDLAITGLPFASPNTTTSNYSSSVCNIINWATEYANGSKTILATNSANSTSLTLFAGSRSTNQLDETALNFSSGDCKLYVTFTYRIA